jgi:hypothetical protein
MVADLKNVKLGDGHVADVERASDDGTSIGKGDILRLEHTDPVLNAKMHLVNNVSFLTLWARCGVYLGQA